MSYVTEEILSGHQRHSITPELSLLQNSLLDSIGLQELLTFLEARYNITIEDENLVPENFSNVRAIAQLIARIAAE